MLQKDFFKYHIFAFISILFSAISGIFITIFTWKAIIVIPVLIISLLFEKRTYRIITGIVSLTGGLIWSLSSVPNDMGGGAIIYFIWPISIVLFLSIFLYNEFRIYKKDNNINSENYLANKKRMRIVLVSIIIISIIVLSPIIMYLGERLLDNLETNADINTIEKIRNKQYTDRDTMIEKCDGMPIGIRTECFTALAIAENNPKVCYERCLITTSKDPNYDCYVQEIKPYSGNANNIKKCLDAIK
jgi:hypothetical protein